MSKSESCTKEIGLTNQQMEYNDFMQIFSAYCVHISCFSRHAYLKITYAAMPTFFDQLVYQSNLYEITPQVAHAISEQFQTSYL